MATHSSTLAWKIPWTEGPWWAAVHGVARSWTRLSDFTFTFHFHALEKEMATHSSVLAWKIPGTGEPGGLPSMGSHRVGHDWSDLAAAAAAAKPSGLCFLSPCFLIPRIPGHSLRAPWLISSLAGSPSRDPYCCYFLTIFHGKDCSFRPQPWHQHMVIWVMSQHSLDDQLYYHSLIFGADPAGDPHWGRIACHWSVELRHRHMAWFGQESVKRIKECGFWGETLIVKSRSSLLFSSCHKDW